MVLKAENTQILVKTGTAQAGQLEASNTNIPNSVVNGGEISAPTDTLNATGATTDVELKTKRSAGEVSQALDKISKQTGLNINKLLEIIEKMTGKSLTDLQNIEQNELTNITTGLGKILNDCKVNGVIDNSRLEKAINDYNIAIQTLWTLDGFYKQQQNVKKSTLTERLIETDCLDEALDPNAHDYEAKMEAAIEKFFEKTLLSRISPNTPQKEREQIYKAQLQTYGRLLVNTTNSRDKELLGAAIDKLYRTNIVTAAKAGLQAMETEEAKANFARHIDLKEAVTTDSEYEKNVYMTAKEAQELANLKYGHMNAEDIKEDLPVMKQEAEEFFEKYKDILAIIDNKKEELTPEERAIERVRDNLHIGRYAGATTGIATSKNSTVIPVKEELLTTVNTDAYEIGEKAGNDFYREVLTEVAKYAEALPDEAKAEFKALMEKAIGENYTKVANDIAKGTKSELTKPEASIENKTTIQEERTAVTSFDENKEEDNSNSIDCRHNPINNINLSAPEELKNNLYNNTNENEEEAFAERTVPTTSQDFVSAVKTGGITAFYDFVKEKGQVKGITSALNNSSAIGSGIVDKAKEMYKRSVNFQDEALRMLSYSGINFVKNITSNITWEKVQNKTFGSFGLTKKIQENSQQALEEKA